MRSPFATWFTVCVALGTAGGACGPKPVTPPAPPPLPEPAEPEFALPDVPAQIATTSSVPSDGHDPSAKTELIDIMAKENRRWYDALSKRDDFPVFYLSYQIYERRAINIGAEGGALVDESDETERAFDVDIRVGTPELDNRRELRDDRLAILTNRRRLARIPFGSDPVAVSNQLWIETDRRYREAIIQYKRVATAQSVTSSQTKRPPDFSHEKPEVYYQKPATLDVDKQAWIDRVRDCSKRANPPGSKATRSACQMEAAVHTVYYVNSEGSQVQTSWTTARLSVSVGVKADDGMGLGRVETVFAWSPDELPERAKVDELIALVNRDLDALHGAPVVDPYTGPAILQGRAAGVFFHEVFGHRVEGHRQKQETSGQTFSTKLGEAIMPPWLSVYDDPQLTTLNGISLHGFYRYDDEGVRAQRATLVDNGVLRGFVLGRNPLDGFPNSNGHGRHEPGLLPVSRQGNLVVEASRSVPDPELKQMLIAEIKRQGKPYGMLFTEISGGFTNTDRFLPQAFKVEPVMAYRVYPDGREELVRGVDIEGTPLIALGSIVAAGRTIEVFNGMCGAESGWVPVSASAPSLLLTQIEVARTLTASDRSPTLPPPSIRSTGDVR